MINRALPLPTPTPVSAFAGPNEQEDNDTYREANGSLSSNVTYFGKADDNSDYFSIYMAQPGNVQIDASNVAGASVTAYFGVPVSGEHIASNGDSNASKGLRFRAQQAGMYYVQVYFYEPDQSTYTLRVTYP